MTIYKSNLLSEFSSLSDSDFISECYRAILLREADADGLNYYLVCIGRGEDRLSLAASLASSAEASALPLNKKGMAGEILARHAAMVAAHAETPEQRGELVRLLNLYFSVLTPPLPSGERTEDPQLASSGDPFSDYLQSVIQTGVSENADIR